MSYQNHLWDLPVGYSVYRARSSQQLNFEENKFGVKKDWLASPETVVRVIFLQKNAKLGEHKQNFNISMLQ